MPNGCKTFIKEMDEREAYELEADRTPEGKEQWYENSWWQLSEKTLRLMRYDATIKDADGRAMLSTLKSKGLMLTEERMHGLGKGKGGGREIRFETTRGENMEEANIRLIKRGEQKARKYTPLVERVE